MNLRFRNWKQILRRCCLNWRKLIFWTARIWPLLCAFFWCSCADFGVTLQFPISIWSYLELALKLKHNYCKCAVLNVIEVKILQNIETRKHIGPATKNENQKIICSRSSLFWSILVQIFFYFRKKIEQWSFCLKRVSAELKFVLVQFSIWIRSCHVAGPIWWKRDLAWICIWLWDPSRDWIIGIIGWNCGT